MKEHRHLHFKKYEICATQECIDTYYVRVMKKLKAAFCCDVDRKTKKGCDDCFNCTSVDEALK